MASMPFSPMSSPCDSYSYTRSVNTPMTNNNNSNKYHSRSSSESLLFTPPLSPTEEQLLAFLIPDIEPSELAAYLSAPATPILSDVSCLIGKNLSSMNHEDQESCYNIEAVYPSPVCAAAAATVAALHRDAKSFPALSVSPSATAVATTTTTTLSFRPLQSSLTNSKKRSSMYAFVGSDDEEDKEEMPLPTDFTSSPTVYVMSSRNTRKRLMLEQAFVSPDEEEDNNSINNCYSQIFHGASSDELDMTTELSSTLAYDLVLA